jgi:hypothetical protein
MTEDDAASKRPVLQTSMSLAYALPGYRRRDSETGVLVRPASDVLAVSLASWIVQDGNYGDFTRGHRRPFALEFHGAEGLIEIDDAAAPSLVDMGAGFYDATGQIAHAAADWWAIDFGTVMFSENVPLLTVRQGAWVSGPIFVGVDPFRYFEEFAHRANAPPLIYDWEIKKIEVQTAPFIRRSSGLMERDPDRIGWKEIDRTNAWSDDDGHAEYILHCRRLEGAPRTTLRP